MGTIIQLPTTNAHSSSEKRGGRKQSPNGYVGIPEAIISEFFKVLRGGGGPDAFVIRRYTLDSEDKLIGQELMRGCVPTKGKKLDTALIRKNQRELETELDDQAPNAFSSIKGRISRNYAYRHHEKNMMFVSCDKGLMACGWYDSANTQKKGLLMCCYMLYAFGSVNGTFDATLLRAVYEYLPFESSFTSNDAQKAEEIVQTFSNPILAEKN